MEEIFAICKLVEEVSRKFIIYESLHVTLMSRPLLFFFLC